MRFLNVLIVVPSKDVHHAPQYRIQTACVVRNNVVYDLRTQKRTNVVVTDADALKAFNAVHQRAIPNATAKTSLTFDDVWKERRLELALEGDRWYDFVRLSYYNPERAISEIKNQRRNVYWNLDPMFKNYYKTGQWQLVNKDDDGNDQTAMYDDQTPAPNVNISSFTIPFPMEDLTFNPHLKEDAIHVNVRETYKY